MATNMRATDMDMPENIIGDLENDSIYGHGGDDTITGDSAMDTAREGHDWINGNKGNDSIDGNQGNDTLRGGMDNDTVNGGAGNDEIWGDLGDDSLSGDAGNDWIHGNAGEDTISGGDGNDTARGGKGNDVLGGGAGNDMLYGDMGDDVISGGAGNDMIMGGDGVDRIWGGAGSDMIQGNTGNDLLYGGYIDASTDVRYDGGDTIHGGKGDDLIYGGLDTVDSTMVDMDMTVTDMLYGDLGDDTIFAGGFATDNAYGDATGNLTVPTTVTVNGTEIVIDYTVKYSNILDGGDGDDVLYGSEGSDTLMGGMGNDTLVGDDGKDELRGGAGDDLLEGGQAIVHSFGGSVSVDVTPTDGGNLLMGEEGNDTLRTYYRIGLASDADTLDGGAGDDVLMVVGQAGSTVAPYKPGLVLIGGSGDDTFDVSNTFATFTRGDYIVIADYAPGSDVIKIAAANEDILTRLQGQDAANPEGLETVATMAELDAIGEIFEVTEDGVTSTFVHVGPALLKLVGIADDVVLAHRIDFEA